MHRRDLLDKLARYAERHPREPAAARMRLFVERRPDCFVRSALEGHVTGSAWIVSPDAGSALLVHHRKLGRWLQPGGHADGNPDTLEVALGEAREETGLRALEPTGADPFDLDIHAIPERAGEPAHLHYDVRYLLRASPTSPLTRSPESHDLRWFHADAPEISTEESLARMSRKARLLLAGPCPRASGDDLASTS
jgi:8-oxo-dGTP pyrophosphatase MutT (NUDIX family)